MADIFSLTPAQHRLGRRIWMALAALAAVDAGLLAISGMGLDFAPAILAVWIFFGCMGLGLFYRFVRHDDVIYFLCQITCQLMLATVVLGIMSYITQCLNLPLLDDRLVAIDRALGFDWWAYLRFVDAQPWLVKMLTFAYSSAGPQMLFVLMVLLLTRHSMHIQRFILCFIISSIVTSILAALLPAVAGYIYYDVDAATTFTHIVPAAARVHEAPLLALRDGSMTDIVFPLKGIVTFPSFHTTIAILLIYASWPVLWMRWITFPLNILVLLSTPVDGGHWMIDVIGGVAVALLCMALTRKLAGPAV